MATRMVKFKVKTEGRNPALTIERLTPVESDQLPKRSVLIQGKNGVAIGKEYLEKGKLHTVLWRIAGNPGTTFDLEITGASIPGGTIEAGEILPGQKFAAGFIIFKVNS